MRSLPTRVQSRYDDVFRKLIGGPDATISVYLHASPPSDTERRQQLVRWRELRQQLVVLGAHAADLELIDQKVDSLPPGDHVLVVLASHGQLSLATKLEGCDEPDSAALGGRPRIIPLLRWEQQQIPTVTAIVHHGEAEISLLAGDPLVTGELDSGPDDEIERNAPGGWSQVRHHRRAEDSWAHSAGAFAAEIARLVLTNGARLLALSGDVHEVQLVLDRLPAEVRRIARTDVRAQPGKDGALQFEVGDLRPLIAETARRERLHIASEFDDSGGRGEAVEGLSDVSLALTKGAVRRLVVVHRHEPEGVDDLAAAAVETCAEIVVLEPDETTLVDGVGATLRF